MQGDGVSYKVTRIPPSHPWVCCTSQLTALKHSPAVAPVPTAVQTSSVTLPLEPWKVLMVCTPLKCGTGLVAGGGHCQEEKAGREEAIVSIF